MCVHAENDVDSGGNEDSCPYDVANDIDSDSICGDVDSCEFDAENGADNDKMCDRHTSIPTIMSTMRIAMVSVVTLTHVSATV